MKKMFFTVLIVVAALVVSKLLEQERSARTEAPVAEHMAAVSETTVFDVKDEQISEEDLADDAVDVEEVNPELTANDDETIIAE